MKKRIAGCLLTLLVVSLLLPVFSFYSAQVTYAAESITTPSLNFSFGKGANSPLGVNIQAAARYQNIGTATVPFDRAQDLGVGWSREELRWDIIEPRPGQYDWKRTDAAINETSKRGIETIGLLCYNVKVVNGEHQKTVTMPNVAAWNKYVEAVVSHYKDRVKYWEIWNEPENPNGYFEGTAEDYGRLLANSYDTIKRVDPSAKVISGGVAPSATEKFLPRMLNAGGRGKFDIWGVHPYLNRSTGPDNRNWVEQEVNSFVSFAKKEAPNAPIWATEFGWNTIGTQITGNNNPDFARVDESQQADYVARSFVQGLAGGLDKMIVYELRDDPNDPQSGYGLTRGSNFDPKVSYGVVKNLATRLAGTTFKGRFDIYAPNRQYFMGFESNDFSFFNAFAPNSTASLSTAQKRSGNSSLQVNFDIPDGKLVSVNLKDDRSFDGLTKVGFFAKGDNNGARLRVVIEDRVGNVFYYPVGVVGGDTWARYEAFLSGDHEQPGVGYQRANPQFPVKIRVQAYTISGETARGTVYIDDVYTNGGTIVQGYRFEKPDKSSVDVVWATDGGDNISIATNSTSVKVFNRDGGAQGGWNVANSNVTGQIGPQMLFVEHNAKDFSTATPSPTPTTSPGTNPTPTPTTSPGTNPSPLPDLPPAKPGVYGDDGFKNTWERVDKAVSELPTAGRGYIWGPGGFYSGTELYNGRTRTVQYFDKARMEVNDPNGNRNDLFFVTTGLLVRELVTGAQQDGDTTFTQRQPSNIALAGDPNDKGRNLNAPTYASFNKVVTGDGSASKVGATINQAIDKNGTVTTITPVEQRQIGAYDAVTRHNIPDVFVNYGATRGVTWNGSSFVEASIFFDNPTYVFGRPISEPFWIKSEVAGVSRDILVQLFERRVLTYTPANDAKNQVEMGNVGQHYYIWRYLQK